MKILSTFFLVGTATMLYANNVDHQVSHVIIFQQQAQVFRSSSISMGTGTQEFVFSRLSNQIDASTIQVSGAGDFLILESYFRNNHLTKDLKPEQLLELEKILDDLHFKDNKLHNEIQSLKEEESLLKANKVLGGKDAKLTVTELTQMANFYRERIQSINDQIFLLQVTQKEVKEEINDVKNQIRELSNEASKLTGEIVVKVQSKKPESGKISINYIVNGASWSPMYDVRVHEMNQPFSLYYNAQIKQRTGEIWENVAVTLSTSSPSRGGTIPTFYPWYLDFYQQRKMANFKAMQSAAMDSEVLFEESAEGLEEYVVVSEQLTSIDYQIEMLVTIASTNQPTKVSIREEQIDADYQYKAYPKISSKVFLTASTKEMSSLDLLPGPMQVFFQGALINQTFLNPDQQSANLTFSLGHDQSINVTRVAQNKFTKDRVIGNKRIKDYTYEITIINNKRADIKLEVIDQLPVSQNADIEVEPNELANASYNKTTGKLIWLKALKSGASDKINYSYSVKFPRDQSISGL